MIKQVQINKRRADGATSTKRGRNFPKWDLNRFPIYKQRKGHQAPRGQGATSTGRGVTVFGNNESGAESQRRPRTRLAVIARKKKHHGGT